MLWLVCYDVSNDSRRQKLAKCMERYCQRVQYSVFECPITEAALEGQLQKVWLPLLDLKTDSLRIYPLDKTACTEARVFGSPPIYEPPDFIIL